MRGNWKGWGISFLCVTILAAGCPAVTAGNVPAAISPSAAGVSSLSERESYLDYLDRYQNVSMDTGEVVVDTADWIGGAGSSLSMMGNKPVVLLEEGGQGKWQMAVPAEGLYHLRLEYCAVGGKATNPEFTLLLDGKEPFSETRYCSIYRVWRDKEAPGSQQDSRGNDIIPGQEMVEEFRQVLLQDHTGTFGDPYLFYLTPGVHTLELQSQREPLGISSLTFCCHEAPPPYAQLAEAYRQAGYTAADAQPITIEAERTTAKADSVLYARSDRSSPDTTPYSPSKIKLNTIGGSSWASQGQWIEWTLPVEKAGLYTFAFRARQNLLSGSFVTRKFYVNGKIPCAEMEDIRISYDMDWQLVELPWPIYLEPGEYTLRMEVTVGSLSSMIARITDTVYQLNTTYRRIVMITGTTPDQYRDYMLSENVPEIFDIFKAQLQVLEDCDRELTEITGKRGSMNGILQTLAIQLEDFIRYPERIQKKLSFFKDNIGALGNWLSNIKQQPLELDKIYAAPAPEEIPSAGSFWRQLVHECKAFFYSFFEDYSLIGDVQGADAVEVWVQLGRDQANILKELVVNDFRPQHSGGVNIKLVQGQLMAATAAGKGPDVALQVVNTEPVNYAVRQASLALSDFADFGEIASRFRDSAMEPYKLEGSIYALPETQTFQMLFYRQDILAEMGLKVPDTWSEMFQAVGKLQRNNMTVGIQPPNSIVGNFNALASMSMLLFQRGGKLYVDGNTRSGLSSDAAVEAFKTWVSLYVDYDLPTKYDALNRFRSGEMPLLIEDFTIYNLLSAAAPELRGLWGMAPVPATLDEAGTPNRSVAGSGTACMILAQTDNPEGAWEFLKWWTSADIQTRYGRELENQMGTAARYPTANIEAFQNIPWSIQELTIINKQWDQVQGIPEVPGGYFTSRHLNNAFRRVLTYNEDPKETLLEYVKNIDEEITAKRHELGMDKEGSP